MVRARVVDQCVAGVDADPVCLFEGAPLDGSEQFFPGFELSRRLFGAGVLLNSCDARSGAWPRRQSAFAATPDQVPGQDAGQDAGISFDHDALGITKL